MEEKVTKTILFDFDGVIVNSFAIAYDIALLHSPDMTREEYRQRFEKNINDFKKHRNPENQQQFFEEFGPKLMQEPVVSGMEDAIKTLAADYTLIIISSTTSSIIRQYLHRQGLLPYFTDILGNDIHQKKTEKFAMVFSSRGIRAQDCIFITDTLGDVYEATELSVPCIAVSWGYHPRETLAKGNPAAFVETPQELIACAADIFRQAI